MYNMTILNIDLNVYFGGKPLTAGSISPWLIIVVPLYLLNAVVLLSAPFLKNPILLFLFVSNNNIT